MRPAAALPNEVRRSVSADKSVTKNPSPVWTTVRQQPLTAMLAPIFSSDCNSDRVWGASRFASAGLVERAKPIFKRPPFLLRLSSSILPRCSMIPVNIVKISLNSEIGAVTSKRKLRESGRTFEPLWRQLRHGDSAVSHDFWSIEQNDFVDEFCLEHRAVQFAPGFEYHAENFAAAHFAQHFTQIHVSSARAYVHDFHAGLSQQSCF